MLETPVTHNPELFLKEVPENHGSGEWVSYMSSVRTGIVLEVSGTGGVTGQHQAEWSTFSRVISLYILFWLLLGGL